MIDIQDLSLLKITKVRDWSICFDYGDKHYLLHGVSECGKYEHQDLYERSLDRNGRYELEHIDAKMNKTEYVSKDYIPQQNGETIIYSRIDKEFFAYKLTKRGFACGLFMDEVEKMNRRIKEIENELEVYRQKENKLRSELYKLR